MDIEQTLAERGARYGSFQDHAVVAQGIKDVMWQTDGWVKLAADQRQALEVIADKIARILNGDPDYVDNWHDIIGYARLVEKRLALPPVEPTTGIDRAMASLADRTYVNGVGDAANALPPVEPNFGAVMGALRYTALQRVASVRHITNPALRRIEASQGVGAILRDYILDNFAQLDVEVRAHSQD